jgi:dipeptidyl aminopeptidase/acylaminoacyl peptidase
MNLLRRQRFISLVLSALVVLPGCVSTYTVPTRAVPTYYASTYAVPTRTPTRGEWSLEKIACHVVHDEDSDVAVPPVSIYVMNGDGSQRTELAEGQYPAWSPDATNLAVVDRYSHTVQTIDLQSGEKSLILQADSYFKSLAWSPDGRRIAVVRDYTSIWVVDADGSNLRHLTEVRFAANARAPSWSPTGTKIAFRDYDEGEEELSDIYAMDIEDSAITRLTDGKGVYFNPVWSPRDDTIAFNSYSDGKYHIIVMNSDGCEQKTIGSGLLYGWSPDGSRVYFHPSSVDDTLWTMNSDGSNPTRLFKLECEHPAWSPVLEAQGTTE